MAADTAALAMVDTASPAATDVEIPNLDSVQTDAETPAVETSVEEAGADKTKTQDGKPTEKPASDGKDVTASSAALTPKAIVEKLSEIKKTDPTLATRLHEEVKNSLEAKRFLSANGAKTFDELKTKLSAPDEGTEQFRSAVEATDEMLYRGDLSELSNNIFEDIKAELGDAAPARLSELSQALLEKIAEADPEGSTRIQRAQFLAASESSGLITSLNKLNGYITAGDTKSAAQLLKAIGAFFSTELKEQSDLKTAATKAATAKAAAEKTSAATLKSLQGEVATEVNKITNDVMGSFLRPFLSAQLKGVPRAELIKAAESIRTDLDQTLGKDDAWKKLMGPKWSGAKTQADKAEMLKLYTDKLKSGLGARVVESTLRRLFPQKFAVAPAAAKAPASTKVMLGGKQATCFTVKARPDNLLRNDLQYNGRSYTAADISLLQVKGMGFVPSSSGKGAVLVSWRQK